MDRTREFLQLTEKLLIYVETMEKTFKAVKKTEKGRDFFSEVKPFADKVKQVNDKWKEEGQVWIETKSPKNIHKQQIESVHEQIEATSVQAFFPETSLTRFKNTIASITYVLEKVILTMKEEKRE